MNKANKTVCAFFWSIFMVLVVEAYSQAPLRNAEMAQALANKLQTGQSQLSYYNTACYFALAGQPTLAFQYLAKDVEDGFSDVNVIKNDQDFVSLHSGEAAKPPRNTPKPYVYLQKRAQDKHERKFIRTHISQHPGRSQTVPCHIFSSVFGLNTAVTSGY